MLLLVDLDNTLVDRASAFDRWASDFIRSHGFSADATAWLIAVDRDGYEPRESLALVDMLLFDQLERMTPNIAV